MMPPTVEVRVYFLVFPRTRVCAPPKHASVSSPLLFYYYYINEVLVSDAADHITGILIHMPHEFEQHSACGKLASVRRTQLCKYGGGTCCVCRACRLHYTLLTTWPIIFFFCSLRIIVSLCAWPTTAANNNWNGRHFSRALHNFTPTVPLSRASVSEVHQLHAARNVGIFLIYSLGPSPRWVVVQINHCTCEKMKHLYSTTMLLI